MKTELTKYGLNDFFIKKATLCEKHEELFLARVTKQHRDIYTLMGENGAFTACVSGKFAYSADEGANYPAIGDWVLADRLCNTEGVGVIHHLIERKSVLIRQEAGTGKGGQVIASNVDIIFICMALNDDFNLRRAERYLTAVWESMATPVIVLTKSDLCEDLHTKLRQTEEIAVGVDVVAYSSKNDEGYYQIQSYIKEGVSVAFVGSSGVGKSTLINRLANKEIFATNTIREQNGKGRHTTTHRELVLLENRGVVIDTPGMREFSVYNGNLSKTFDDVERIITKCKYKDCTHTNEPGCMVRHAISEGALSPKRLESYSKLQRELAYDRLNSRQTEREKLNKMFGSKSEFVQFRKQIKSKNK